MLTETRPYKVDPFYPKGLSPHGLGHQPDRDVKRDG
jgi:hypothetical protein